MGSACTASPKQIQCTMKADNYGKRTVRDGGEEYVREEGAPRMWTFKTSVPRNLREAHIDATLFQSVVQEINTVMLDQHVGSCPSRTAPKDMERWGNAVAVDLTEKFSHRLKLICPPGWMVEPFEYARKVEVVSMGPHGGTSTSYSMIRLRWQQCNH
eukprot:TRINITY_DN67564_c12_g5_i1.p1 TRINITY_DN67564_c12_g5~~TRINITY_DN67564_c12_g5_i1.p1  ORF type:complete len:157 (-),score=7.70 TRINITY_DN67564_c12_g5_i1:207-677(-)